MDPVEAKGGEGGQPGEVPILYECMLAAMLTEVDLSRARTRRGFFPSTYLTG